MLTRLIWPRQNVALRVTHMVATSHVGQVVVGTVAGTRVVAVAHRGIVLVVSGSSRVVVHMGVHVVVMVVVCAGTKCPSTTTTGIGVLRQWFLVRRRASHATNVANRVTLKETVLRHRGAGVVQVDLGVVHHVDVLVVHHVGVLTC